MSPHGMLQALASESQSHSLSQVLTVQVPQWVSAITLLSFLGKMLHFTCQWTVSSQHATDKNWWKLFVSITPRFHHTDEWGVSGTRIHTDVIAPPIRSPYVSSSATVCRMLWPGCYRCRKGRVSNKGSSSSKGRGEKLGGGGGSGRLRGGGCSLAGCIPFHKRPPTTPLAEADQCGMPAIEDSELLQATARYCQNCCARL